MFAVLDDLLSHKEIEQTPKLIAIGLVYLSISASSADDCSELLVLNVEHFRPESTGSPEFAGLIFAILAFWTCLFQCIHRGVLPLIYSYGELWKVHVETGGDDKPRIIATPGSGTKKKTTGSKNICPVCKAVCKSGEFHCRSCGATLRK